jgi:NitT/TauT family transport system permease protein
MANVQERVLSFARILKRASRRLPTISSRLPISQKRFDQLVGIVLIALVWEVYGTVASNFFFAPLSDTLIAFYDLFFVTRDALEALSFTLRTVAIGYTIALLVAFPVGALMGTLDTAEYLLDSYVNLMFVTSVTSVLPFLIILYGTTDGFYISVVFLFCVFHMILNFQAGFENVDRELVDAGRVFGASGWRLYKSVHLPAALPLIIAGLRIGLGRSIAGIIAAELWVSAGIGELLMGYQRFQRIAYVFALVLFLMGLAIVAVRGIYYVEENLAPWEATEGV